MEEETYHSNQDQVDTSVNYREQENEDGASLNVSNLYSYQDSQKQSTQERYSHSSIENGKDSENEEVVTVLRNNASNEDISNTSKPVTVIHHTDFDGESGHSPLSDPQMHPCLSNSSPVRT